MSTLTPHRPSLRGPVRVVVRQQRRTLRIAGALALAGIIALVAYALWVSQVADSFAAGPCSGPGDTGRGCDKEVGEYSDTMFDFRYLLAYANLFLMYLPGVISAFAAGPLIARELESGTYKVAWTQSVTPARWLAAKLAVPTVVLLAAVSVLSAVTAWARTHSEEHSFDWYDDAVFATTGTVTIGYTLLGITVGALTGLLMRRTVPAMSVAALVTGMVILTLTNLRSALWPIRTATGSASGKTDTAMDSWVLEQGPLTSSGERLPTDVCRNSMSREAQCMAEHDITGWFADYHPASHFWPLQLVETGILLLLAALAVALAFRVLRRRHA